MGSDTLCQLKSSQGDVLEIETRAACLSGFIANMVADLDVGTDNVIPLLTVRSGVLREVIDYCNCHVDNVPDEIPKPLKSCILQESSVSQQDSHYISKFDLDDLIELANAADYLQIPSLVDLTCSKIASMLYEDFLAAATVSQRCTPSSTHFSTKVFTLCPNSTISEEVLTRVKGLDDFEADLMEKLGGRKNQKFIKCIVRRIGCAEWGKLTPWKKWCHVQSARSLAPKRTIYEYSQVESISPRKDRALLRRVTSTTPEAGSFRVDSSKIASLGGR